MMYEEDKEVWEEEDEKKKKKKKSIVKHKNRGKIEIWLKGFF
jgi:hypothetical protein